MISITAGLVWLWCDSPVPLWPSDRAHFLPDNPECGGITCSGPEGFGKAFRANLSDTPDVNQAAWWTMAETQTA